MQEYTLSELSELIKQTINNNFDNYYWVKAEINQINVNYSGHAYLSLIEKSETDNNIIANLRAVIWANKFSILSAYFSESTGTTLEAGIKLLVKVEVSFHNVYGLSLIIHDIDPTYTLGDFAKKRQQIIKQLEEDGIFDLNKNLEFPLVPQRVAVISSPSAAGFADFVDHIVNNDYNYQINFKLFEATMQGEKTEQSVINALNKIAQEEENFDIVAIIRGGGAKIDLSAFDSYNIATNIAQFPLPILTGIGHQIDLSIADMVSYKSLKTPTATAEFIIQKIVDFELQISNLFDRIIKFADDYIHEQSKMLDNLSANLNSSLSHFISSNNNELILVKNSLQNALKNFFTKKNLDFSKILEKLNYIVKYKIENERNKLNLLESETKNSIKEFFSKNKKILDQIEIIINNNDPRRILKLGYTITRKNGKIVKDATQLNPQDIIETTFWDTSVKSKIIDNQEVIKKR